MIISAIKHKIVLALALVFLFSGCALFESSNNSNNTATNGTQTVSSYYFAAFEDVPIPSDMSTVTSGAFLVASPEAGKIGFQSFKGRVDMSSLANYIQTSMENQGWKTCSAVRFDKTFLYLFEKSNKYCIIKLKDSTINTLMDVAVTPKLTGSTPTLSNTTSSSGYGVQSLSQ